MSKTGFERYLLNTKGWWHGPFGIKRGKEFRRWANAQWRAQRGCKVRRWGYAPARHYNINLKALKLSGGSHEKDES